ncbi:MAG: 1-acyl-sn-glycerol-3-phosphate acyltransferase [Clostridia bacterium]|nr:1-acyl-sn-glycerol-3-phosphate acyltransferase [Clostridia bacterium]MBR0159637.1 1-acyl-sn-glycerol-3-phosphate acyltransferase [Clostridia bacterium]
MWFLRLICRFIFRVFVPTKVFYPERMPESGACVVASNHETMLDMFMIGYRIRRKVKWLAKQSLFKFKPFGWLLKKCGAFPVKRDNRDVAAVTHCLELLHEGEAIGIFPQGTRSKGRGLSLTPKTGFLRMAVLSGAPVVPVAIWGKIRLFGKVYVKFGEPIPAEQLIDPDKAEDKAAQHEAAEAYMRRVYAMMEVTEADKASLKKKKRSKK